MVCSVVHDVVVWNMVWTVEYDEAVWTVEQGMPMVVWTVEYDVDF